jgi:plasmid stabilization system protein ParE
MVARIAWVTVAREQYRKLVVYLFERYSEEAIQRFDARLEKKLDLLKKQPEAGRPSQIEGVRFVTLSGGRYRLYYRHQGNTIYLLYLWDNKQNPSKNPYK